MLELNKIYNMDCLKGLKQLPDNSINCCVTSPPYWGLRDYGVEGQIGLEKTPEEYVAKMVEVFQEVKRVLRDDGTLWLNLGDSYMGSWGNYAPTGKGGQRAKQVERWRRGAYEGKEDWRPPTSMKQEGIKPKDLVGIPWMVAFALRADGWYLRQDIIWHKPNAMPESVKDRCTKAHEYIFLLSKSRHYYYDQEAIKEPAAYDGRKDTFLKGSPKYAKGVVPGQVEHSMAAKGHERWKKNERGEYVRNKRSVWTIPTKPFKEAHFAVFPPEIPEICIKAGTSEKGCCSKCGSPWQRVTEKGEPILQAWSSKGAGQYDINEGVMKRTGIEQGSTLKHIVPVKTVGWKPTCSCGIEETVPCTVIDPFAGAGTTLYVAEQLGRNSIGIELNPEYIEIAKRRLNSVQLKLVMEQGVDR